MIRKLLCLLGLHHWGTWRVTRSLHGGHTHTVSVRACQDCERTQMRIR